MTQQQADLRIKHFTTAFRKGLITAQEFTGLMEALGEVLRRG